MARAYSMDLRGRVVAAVDREGMSCHATAARFGVVVSTVVKWLQRYRRTGSVAPGQMGGNRPRAIAGVYREWLIGRCQGGDFTLRGLVAGIRPPTAALRRGKKACDLTCACMSGGKDRSGLTDGGDHWG